MYVSAKRESSAHSSTRVKSPQEVHPACDPVSKGNAIPTELINSKWGNNTVNRTMLLWILAVWSWSEGDGVTYSEVEETPVRHCEYDQIWINSSFCVFVLLKWSPTGSPSKLEEEVNESIWLTTTFVYVSVRSAQPQPTSQEGPGRQTCPACPRCGLTVPDLQGSSLSVDTSSSNKKKKKNKSTNYYKPAATPGGKNSHLNELNTE